MPDATAAVPLYAVALRIARLGPTGAPVVGPDNLLVTHSLVRVTYANRYTETDAVQKLNGRGKPCLNVAPRKTFAGVDLTLEVCEDDPALTELLQGGSVITAGAGADVIGYQWPKGDDDENRLSVEVWTEAWVGDQRDPVLPYYRYAFPLASLAQGERQAGAEPDEHTYEGTGSANSAWGDGPANDWTWDSSAAAQYVRTAVAPPAPTNGYAATPPAV